MKQYLKLIWGAVMFFLVLTTAHNLWAMPSFARAYRTSCITCHEAFPKRNAVGEAFRLNGFKFADDESYRKQEPVEMGDEAYKRLWPEAMWPSSIPAQLPLSVVARMMAELDMDGTREDTLMFIFPEELELVWAGNLAENIFIYGDVIFIQKDFGGDETESWATVKAWIEFQDLIGPERSVNLRVGSVGTQGMGLYTSRDSNSLSTHYYLYSEWAMPKVKVEESGLIDFQGNPFTVEPQIGLELNGRGKRWMYSAGVVTGNVKNSASEPPEDDIFFVGAGDDTGSKDVFFQTAYKIGGLGFDGSGMEVENPLTARPEYWRDDSLTLSLFGYNGTAEIDIVDAMNQSWTGDDEFWRLALGFQQKYKDLAFGGAYMIGNNDNPYGYLSEKSVDSEMWMVEASYFVYPWLIPFGRYEALDLDLPEDVLGLNPDQDYARFVVGVKAMIRANVALTFESSFYTDGEDLYEGVDNTLFVLLSASF